MTEVRENKGAEGGPKSFWPAPGLILFVGIMAAAGSFLVWRPPGCSPTIPASGLRQRAASAMDLAFLEAVRKGDLAEVKNKLKTGADIRAKDEFGQSALHVVKDVRVAQFLLSQGADVNLRDKDFLMTPLFSKEVPIAKLLVAAGADVNARSNKGNTPLIWYSYSSYLDGIKYLLSAGADINARNDDGQNALDVAEHFADKRTVEFLRARMQQEKK